MKKIVIFGQWRTGTTGLFYKIKNSLPPKTPVYFEPTYYKQPLLIKRNTGYELAKVILAADQGNYVAKYDDFLHFDKKILIVRNPRDWIISATLFQMQQNASIYSDKVVLNNLIDVLNKKETAPDSVSLIEIAELIIKSIPGKSLDTILQWTKEQHQLVFSFEDNLSDYFLIRYEDFVDGKLEELQDYLGLDLIGEAVIDDEERTHIQRTKSYDNWKNWFLDEDIEVFKPIFDEYIKRYGYDNAWAYNEERTIDPRHCSEYVTYTIDKRIELNNESYLTKKLREIKYRMSYI